MIAAVWMTSRITASVMLSPNAAELEDASVTTFYIKRY